jgi:hypothetical protein
MHISTFVVAFLRPIWSMGLSDLPGGPNTNVSSPVANQVHSMTLCAMQVVRGRRANGSGHGAVHGVALCSPTYQSVVLAARLRVVPPWGCYRGTRSYVTTGNRRSDAQAFDDTANSREQSTSGVTHGHEVSTAAT